MITSNNVYRLAELSNNNYAKEIVNESVITFIADSIKSLISKAIRIVRGVIQKVKRAASNIVNKVKDFFGSVTFESQENSYSYQTQNWGLHIADSVKHKAANASYGEYFEMYNWDNRFVESLPEKFAMFDNMQAIVNNQSVVISTREFVKVLNFGLDNYENNLNILDSYKRSSERQVPKIFNSSDTKLTESDLIDNATRTHKIRIPVTPRLVDDMIRIIETTPDQLHNVEVSYRDFENKLHQLRKELDAISADRVNSVDDKIKSYINQFSIILLMKLNMFNLVQTTNVKLIGMRSNEYMNTLIAYARQ